MSRTSSPEGKCKSCGADVLWAQQPAKSEGGKPSWIPLDPAKEKRIIATPHRKEDGRLVAEIVIVHRAHWATCTKKDAK